MEAQEIFDKVYEHLRSQNKKAVNSSSNTGFYCKYRSKDGLKCAVGCLIDDEDYDSMMEGIPASQLLTEFAWKPSINRIASNPALLEELQRVHDGSAPSLWPRRLAQVAKRHHLKVPELGS